MKKIITGILIGIAGLFYVTETSAQPAAGKVAEKMTTFHWMIGDWSGEAWYLGRDQKKTLIIQKEHIISRLDGALITMEGTGYDKMPGSGDAKMVFQAFGILTYDLANSKFVLRAYQGENFIDSDLSSNPDGSFYWIIDASYGKTRYTITHMPDGKWHEKGEISRDGTTWNNFFEMTLSKEETLVIQ
jgi:hypothetical protein